MSKTNSQNTHNSKLLSAASMMRESLQILKEINNKANIIALNAAIEGARTRGRLDSFSIVAEQILTQANRNAELSEQLEKLVGLLQNVALRSTAARYFELAEDLIDKLDRNLFERNCDVQAWTTFETILNCAIEGQNYNTEEAQRDLSNHVPTTEGACILLRHLMAIYVVYEDIFLLNKNGIVLAAGQRQDIIGKSFKDSNWFKEASSGKVHISDMQFSESLNNYSVYYSAPVTDKNGMVIGVCSSRFNWNYAQEMINSGGYEPNVQAYFLNKNGLVLASTDAIGIYRDTMDWLDAGRFSMGGHCGYSVESARNGAAISIGFSRTKGYNSYRGKEWSALISARLGNVQLEHLEKIVTSRNSSESGPTEPGKSERMIESEICNNELQKTMFKINELVSQINATNNETNMLAVNAAIQAGIAGTEGESFSVIATEIGNLAEKSVGFVKTVNKTAKDLQSAVFETVAARLSDAARDAIDKVDRNLFERYCDVQAWSTFDMVIQACLNGDKDGKTSKVLARLHQIYEVYHDIILLDASGKIIACGVRRELIGHNQSNRAWFQETITGKVSFTDVYRSQTVNGLTMAFSAPVIGPDGNVIGVLTTRFNWDFIYHILDAVIVDSRSKVYLINNEGCLLGTPDRDGVLEKSFSHLQAYRKARGGSSGHLIETDPQDKHVYSIGYSRTKGYNTYPGRNWSVIIRRADDLEQISNEAELINIQTDVELKPKAG